MRPVRLADADEYAEMMGDPDVMRFVGLTAGQVLTSSETRELVTGAVETWRQRGYGRWSIFSARTGEFVGFCGFRCEDGKPEFIEMIRTKFWGSGFAGEAARACLDYGFGELGFDEVRSFCRPLNTRARTLMDRLGAEFLGLIDFRGVEGAAYRMLAPV